MGHFGKYHDSLCFTPPNFAIALFLFSLGTIVSPKGNWKQCLCKIWGGGGLNKKYYGIFRSGLLGVFDVAVLLLTVAFHTLVLNLQALNITNIARELKAILIRERVFLIPLYAPNDHFSRLVLPAKNSAFP